MVLDENILIFIILMILLFFIINCFSLNYITNKLPKIESMRSGGGGGGGGRSGGGGGSMGGGGGRSMGGGGGRSMGVGGGRSMGAYGGLGYQGGHNNVRMISNNRRNNWNNRGYYNIGNGGNYPYNNFGYVDPILLSEPVLINEVPIIYKEVIVQKVVS